MNYTHLTQDERYQIAILAKAGHDQSEIAATVTIRSRYPAFSIAEVTGTRQDIQISPGDLLNAR